MTPTKNTQKLEKITLLLKRLLEVVCKDIYENDYSSSKKIARSNSCKYIYELQGRSLVFESWGPKLQ